MSDAIASVIKCDTDNTCFVWKHPLEDFNTGTQLIVHESQEAVFFMNGQALDSFGPGRHTLTTQNMPLVGGFFHRTTGDTTPFHCEVYFVNKTEQLAIKWGTSSKLEYLDPTYGFPIRLGASGEMSLRVENARQLLVKVVGTERALSQERIVEKLRAFLQLRLKSSVAAMMKQEKISVFEIDEHLERISEALRDKLRGDFLDYGFALEKFLVLSVIKPEDDRDYRRFRELHFRQYTEVAEAKLRQQVGVIEQQTKAQQMVIEAEGMARKRSLEGYTYQDERRFDVAERFAENEATGQLANLGVGVGMIGGIGGAVGGNVGGIMNQALSGAATPAAPADAVCCKCGAKLAPGAAFCSKCGEKQAPAAPAAVTCPKCGKSVPADKFCAACGQRLTPPGCPKCGTEVAPGASFCPHCGEKLN